ncbi:hypothetical protein ACIRYZ_44795 [Kitasatospora sp. NPDC101155]|uniref:hypothetical protein n=1 Tax=Kitasatospora sp. NPDC101155 TaxID=3364097 RepID=UPI0037FFDD7E
MGDGRFTVDLQDLEKLAQGLDDAKNQLDTAMKAMGQADIGALGLQQLADACKHFQDRWGYGLGQLGDDAKALHQGLQDVLKNYNKTESDLTAALQGKPAPGAAS